MRRESNFNLLHASHVDGHFHQVGFADAGVVESVGTVLEVELADSGGHASHLE